MQSWIKHLAVIETICITPPDWFVQQKSRRGRRSRTCIRFAIGRVSHLADLITATCFGGTNADEGEQQKR